MKMASWLETEMTYVRTARNFYGKIFFFKLKMPEITVSRFLEIISACINGTKHVLSVSLKSSCGPKTRIAAK
jgi:hypothetical protein